MVEEISGAKCEGACDNSTIIRWLKKFLVQNVKVHLITVQL